MIKLFRPMSLLAVDFFILSSLIDYGSVKTKGVSEIIMAIVSLLKHIWSLLFNHNGRVILRNSFFKWLSNIFVISQIVIILRFNVLLAYSYPWNHCFHDIILTPSDLLVMIYLLSYCRFHKLGLVRQLLLFLQLVKIIFELLNCYLFCFWIQSIIVCIQ